MPYIRIRDDLFEGTFKDVNTRGLTGKVRAGHIYPVYGTVFEPNPETGFSPLDARDTRSLSDQFKVYFVIPTSAKDGFVIIDSRLTLPADL